MMPFSRALAYGCLVAGKWLMLLTAVLFAALFVSDYWRVGAHSVSAIALGGAGGSLALAGVCWLFSRWIIAA
jgi:nitrate reductase gamma subunit